MNDVEQAVVPLLMTTEARMLLDVCSGMLWGLIAFLGIVGVTHALYRRREHSWLYRKRRPAKGWDKQFYPALAAMFVLIGIVLWVVSVLREGYVPWR